MKIKLYEIIDLSIIDKQKVSFEVNDPYITLTEKKNLIEKSYMCGCDDVVSYYGSDVDYFLGDTIIALNNFGKSKTPFYGFEYLRFVRSDCQFIDFCSILDKKNILYNLFIEYLNDNYNKLSCSHYGYEDIEEYIININESNKSEYIDIIVKYIDSEYGLYNYINNILTNKFHQELDHDVRKNSGNNTINAKIDTKYYRYTKLDRNVYEYYLNFE